MIQLIVPMIALFLLVVDLKDEIDQAFENHALERAERDARAQLFLQARASSRPTLIGSARGWRLNER